MKSWQTSNYEVLLVQKSENDISRPKERISSCSPGLYVQPRQDCGNLLSTCLALFSTGRLILQTYPYTDGWLSRETHLRVPCILNRNEFWWEHGGRGGWKGERSLSDGQWESRLSTQIINFQRHADVEVWFVGWPKLFRHQSTQMPIEEIKLEEYAVAKSLKCLCTVLINVV